jgi:hypothetical protein
MNDLVISLVTLPALALVLTFRTTSRLLTEVGELSEELFRGDRLPPLEFDTEEKGPLTPNSVGK